MAFKNDYQDDLRRRVQHKIAENYFKDFENEKPQRLSDALDEDTRAEIERQYGPYKKKETPYTIQNVLWFIAALVTFHFTGFLSVVLYDAHIHRMWFNVGVVLISINVTIAMFCIIWLSYVKGVKSIDWEQQHPAAIPIATAAFVIGALCVNVGLWPVWSFLTPAILFILFMGIVVTIAWLPACI